MVAHIPPDISYGLECSVEMFDITNDVMTYYYGFNEANLAQLVDDHQHGDDDIGESLRGLSRLYMRPYNDWFYNRANPDERTWCVASAARRYGRQSAEMVDHLITKYVSDMLSQGRDPLARRHQQDWLNSCRIMTHSAKITAQLARKARMCDVDDLTLAIQSPETFSLRIARPKVIVPELLTNRDVVDGMVERGHPIFRQSQPVQSAKLLAKKKRERESVMKKSAAFLSRLISPTDVSMFVSGKEIRITGQRFIFSIRKGNILSANHGALTIWVHDRTTDARLFSLCWYVERTPALDQISALVLAVRTGNEEEIIRTANVMQRDHDNLAAHPHVHDLVPMRTPVEMGGFRLPADDILMHHFPGTTEYHHSHPDLYRVFAQRCAKRLQAHFPDRFAGLFVPDRPETVRPFIDGRIERALLPEPQRQFALMARETAAAA